MISELGEPDEMEFDVPVTLRFATVGRADFDTHHKKLLREALEREVEELMGKPVKVCPNSRTASGMIVDACVHQWWPDE